MHNTINVYYVNMQCAAQIEFVTLIYLLLLGIALLIVILIKYRKDCVISGICAYVYISNLNTKSQCINGDKQLQGTPYTYQAASFHSIPLTFIYWVFW